MQQKTRLFQCPNQACKAQLGIVGNIVGDLWTPPDVTNISGHTQGHRGLVPCDVQGKYSMTSNGIGQPVQQTHAAHA